MLNSGFFSAYTKHNPLAIKLLAAIILCSSAITLLATSSQLYFDYQYERTAIDEGVKQIESSSLASIENSLWEISPEQVKLQLQGLNKLRDIEYLSIQTPFNEHYSSGKQLSSSVLIKEYALAHSENNITYALGTLRVVISLDGLYQRLWDKALIILMSQGIKTFFVSLFILSIFYHLITQHLAMMAKYARNLHINQLQTPLILNRTAPATPDELSDVIDSFNSMRNNMQIDFQKRLKAEQQLETLNENLELRVQQRTAQLQQTNNELQATLENLKQTQNQLIQSKKMASLGNLVAGVAHEISTPIGIGYTAASYLEQQALQNVDDLTEVAVESSKMICQNLERAASLVSAFKQVSVDQSTENKRVFNLDSYLQEVLLSLKPKLRDSKAHILVNCPKDLGLNSYPGSYYQIFNNLIINSLIHAPKDLTTSVNIRIEITLKGDFIYIDYFDDGVGINKNWRAKVFEPFATSKRNKGCSGLGMHICYNIINQLLKGEIHCLNHRDGAHFQIKLPSDIQVAIENKLVEPA
jgi:signal transduction histidine kinase